MYAVIATGGKQYCVAEGDLVQVERLAGEAGSTITFDRVLMVGGKDAPKVGTPVLAGVTVEAKIIEQGRDKKIIVLKKKRRKGYQKRQGHRQYFTEVQVTKIAAA